MATVTGLTAERMLAIEAASVVDGDIVGDDLILTTKGGSQINAGNVRGPQGPQGPMGEGLQVLASKLISDVGVLGQIRAGRQLLPTDFTSMDLSTPIGLWNLSDLTDVSGNGRNLLNKGGIPFGVGINGLAATSAVFSGLVSQALYILDAGVNDPFKLKHGSMGCWFRTAKRGVIQPLISKSGAGATFGWELQVNVNNGITGVVSPDGNLTYSAASISDVVDDRWHFAVMTVDGQNVRIYIDGVFEGLVWYGSPIFATNGPLNIGCRAADAAANGTQSSYNRIDEAFVTGDVLTEDEIRFLYCSKIPHTLTIEPMGVHLSIRRRRRGGSWTVGDFPAQPLRLHNFVAGSLADEGSNAKPLTNNGPALVAPGAAGIQGNAFIFSGAQSLSSHDGQGLTIAEQLPSGLSPRTYGCWFKASSSTGMTFLSWGTNATGDVRLQLFNGFLYSLNGSDMINAQAYIADGQWHFVCVVEDDAASGGIKRKMYFDGRLVASSTVMQAIVLAGANRFRIGADSIGGAPFTGLLDGVFVSGSAFTHDQIQSLWSRGSQLKKTSPKNSGDHVEAMDSTHIYATFDSLETSHLVDLGVLG